MYNFSWRTCKTIFQWLFIFLVTVPDILSPDNYTDNFNVKIEFTFDNETPEGKDMIDMFKNPDSEYFKQQKEDIEKMVRFLN